MLTTPECLALLTRCDTGLQYSPLPQGPVSPPDIPEALHAVHHGRLRQLTRGLPGTFPVYICR